MDDQDGYRRGCGNRERPARARTRPEPRVYERKWNDKNEERFEIKGRCQKPNANRGDCREGEHDGVRLRFRGNAQSCAISGYSIVRRPGARASGSWGLER